MKMPGADVGCYTFVGQCDPCAIRRLMLCTVISTMTMPSQ